MALADLLLLIAFLVFLIAAIVGYVRSKMLTTAEYIAIGLALVTLVTLLADRAL
jgi:uncharacterized membrane protein YuzA (DUF378 family)